MFVFVPATTAPSVRPEHTKLHSIHTTGRGYMLVLTDGETLSLEYRHYSLSASLSLIN